MPTSSTIVILAAALALHGCEHFAASKPKPSDGLWPNDGGYAATTRKPQRHQTLRDPKSPDVTPSTFRASPPEQAKAPPAVVVTPKAVQPKPAVKVKRTRAECEELVKQVKFKTLFGDQSRVKLRRKWWINDCVAGKV